MYLLGFDIGSSSIKAALVDASTGAVLGTAQAPDTEMEILAPKPGWAEQDPDDWWLQCKQALAKLFRQTGADASKVAAIGISYQMHGLVTIDREGKSLRPAIIWCDSRAVSIGDAAFREIGEDYCLQHYLNGPGNFTASKLKWVRDEQPELYEKIHRAMLPGDYIAFKLTGEALTTISGLSEGILWDFQSHSPASRLLEHYGIEAEKLAPLAPSFGDQGRVSAEAAKETGLPAGIPVTYRAGDQPNNALSLNVLEPGELAATAGTSGVIYGVIDRLAGDAQNRVNSFAHVNHQRETPRIGVLLCINGTGIQYRWLKQQVAAAGQDYPDLEQAAATVQPGSEGLQMIPFGNGAERMLGNRQVGAHILNLDFNRHKQAHLYRAGLEGIAFSFAYGADILKSLGLNLSVLRVGNDNLFQSAIFAQTVAQLLHCRIEVLRTTGAVGAAVASGVGIGVWDSPRVGLGGLAQVCVYEPVEMPESLLGVYNAWNQALKSMLRGQALLT